MLLKPCFGILGTNLIYLIEALLIVMLCNVIIIIKLMPEL
jgi:hypothetical protein